MMETGAFWVLATAIVTGALLSVTLPNLLHAAVAFIGTLIAIAFLFLLMRQEFVAVTQILGYVGGVIVFVVYTILLTSRLGERGLPARPAAMIASGLLAGAALAAVVGGAVQAVGAPGELAAGVSLSAIGTRLLDPGSDGFLVPFEVVSVLLLTALIGAATVAMGRRDAASPAAAAEGREETSKAERSPVEARAEEPALLDAELSAPMGTP